MRSSAVVFFISMFSVAGFASTIYVPDQLPTIQQAIVQSHHGDTILVAPGTYIEGPLDFMGRAVTVKSSHGPELTEIWGDSASDDVVKFLNKEGSDSVLEGFTVAGKRDSVYCHPYTSPTIVNNVFKPMSGYANRGIWVSGKASPLIMNNSFYGNWANQYGGHIYCSAESSPEIVGNLFYSGHAVEGAGVHCAEYAAPKIRNNIFYHCRSKMGGAVFCNTSSPLIESNTFIGCSAMYGGALHCYRSESIIRNNLFYYNHASDFNSSGKGGALYCTKSAPYIINNTILENFAEEMNGGGGIYIENSYPVIANSILWGNKAWHSWPSPGYQIYDSSGMLEVSHCIVEGGWPGKNNIDEDPHLLKRWWEFLHDEFITDVHAMDYSLCIDAGDNNAPYIPDQDFHGNDRVFDGDWDEKAIIDIGCNEFVALLVPEEYTFIQDAIENASTGEVVFVAPGTYYENIKFGPKNVIVSSRQGPEKTVIDGQDKDSTVAFYTDHEAEPYLIGFTITGGQGKGLPDFKGGGIACFNSSPVIDRCIIRDNHAEYAGGGICLRDHSLPVISNCIIYDNLAHTFGGGLACYGSLSTYSALFSHCTFYGNTAMMQGGAIHCDTSNPKIKNSIIWKNNAPNRPSISLEMSSPTVSYNDIEFGWPGFNIDADPLFKDPKEGDFHLQPHSPCVDSGHSGGLWLDVKPSFDIDGQLRSKEEIVDMGVDEYIED